MRTACLALIALLWFLPHAVAQRVDVSIPASRDVTLYEDPNGQLTNDAGGSLYLGKAGPGQARRVVLAFDVAAHVPVGAHIVFAQLQLTVQQGPAGAPPLPVTLWRATNPWPEGSTAAPGPGDQGTQAASGDCTWLHRGYPSTFWSQPGGDVLFVPSAQAQLPAAGVFAVGPTDQLVRDVQAWLDGTVRNDGWQLRADETAVLTARRLHSRQTTFVGVDPQLQIGYVARGSSWDRGAGCAGASGQPLHQTLVGAPRLQTQVHLVVQNGVPQLPTVALIALGFRQVPVDIVPGCPYELDDQWFDNFGPLLFNPQGVADYVLTIPNLPFLFGLTLGLESVALDPSSPNTIVFSNGTLVVIG